MEREKATPLVSMVIPAYNHAAYVRECIGALIDQDYPNIELIIIDDGSEDDTVQRIEEMIPSCRARFVRFEFRARPNRGLTKTMNEAMEWAKGYYFAMIASDDVLRPNKTSVLVGCIEGDDALAGVFSGCELIDDRGSIVGMIQPRAGSYDFDDIMDRKATIVTPSQLLRLDLVRAVGGYAQDLYFEDWYMWLALTKRGFKLKVVPEVLVQYRQHVGSMSRAAAKMYEGRKAMLKYFSGDRGYKRSLSWVCVTAAIDFSRSSRMTSLRLLAEALWHYPLIVVSGKFYSAIARVLSPTAILDIAKKRRDKRLATSSRTRW